VYSQLFDTPVHDIKCEGNGMDACISSSSIKTIEGTNAGCVTDSEVTKRRIRVFVSMSSIRKIE
jgi:hypothetical protein